MILAIHVVVKYKADLGKYGVAVKGVFDHIALGTDPAVRFTAVDAVAHDLCAAGGLLGQRGELSLVPRNVAIVLHQRLLELADIDILDRTTVGQCLRDCRAECLSENGASRHDT